MKYAHHALRVLVLTGAFALSALSPVRANTIWYVNHAATGTGTGLSWTNAFTTVAAAITAASTTVDAQGHSDQIWVAEGSYFPPVAGGTSNGYFINKPLALYGAFKGTETSVSGRLGSYIKTILDGNINNPSIFTDNAAHVVVITGVAGVVVIDGFLIQNGYCNANDVNGAGISATQSHLTLANCFVKYNYNVSTSPGAGGGLYFTSGSNHLYPTNAYILNIKDCQFDHDHAFNGGGMYCDEVAGEVVNTQFLENLADPYGAGAYLERMGSSNRLDFTNCAFWDNITTAVPGVGGALYLADTGGGGNAQIVNCSFNENTCASGLDGEAMFISTNSLATIYNSIFWGNNSNGSTIKPIAGSATINYSDIEGGWSGGGGTANKNVDPKFANPALARLTLQSTSPCIDCADYSQLPLDDLDVDNDGNTTEVIPLDVGSLTRLVQDTAVNDSGNGGHNCSACIYLDMGAYERQGP